MDSTWAKYRGTGFGTLSVFCTALLIFSSCGDESKKPAPESSTNLRPLAHAGADQRISIGTRVILNGSRSSDPENEPITYRWSQLSGAPVELMDTSGQMVTFISPSEPGLLVFELVTHDGVQDSFPNTVNIDVYRADTNQKPLANAGMNLVVMGGERVTLDGSASRDPDGDALDYIWEQVSGTRVQLNNDNSAQADFVAPNENVDLDFGLIVNDGVLDSDLANVTIRVRTTTVNLPPLAEAGPDQNAGTEAIVTLDGSASSDPENNSLSYRWTQVMGSPVQISDLREAAPRFRSPSTAGLLRFELVVNDGNNDSTPDAVDINVVAGNRPPVANAGQDQTVLGGTMVYLDSSLSYDPDGDPLVASWAFTSSDTAVLAVTEGATTRFRAPNTPTTLQIQLLVTDGVTTSTPAFVLVTVSNRRPISNAGDDFTAELSATARLNGQSSSDADGHALTPHWTQISGTHVSLIDPNSLRPSFIPTSTGAMVFELIVNDGQVDSAADQVTVFGVEPGFIDSDNDFLSDDDEAILGTDPNNADSDKDGIPDGWEILGHENVDFPALGCNPRRRNILVEVDYQHYTANGRLNSARPSETWKNAVKTYFASLDIPNHDGTSGIDIQFFDDSPLDADFRCYYNSTNSVGDSSPAQFAYREAFHKATFCIGGGRGNSPISGRSLKLTSARTNNTESDDLSERAQFSRYFLFLHELGHSLGLLHGGNVNTNRKPNYTSLMNYEYDASFNGSPRTIQGTAVHYSQGTLPELDECNLEETNALASVPISDLSFLQFYGPGWTVDTNHNIDWNNNSMIETSPYSLVLRLQPSPASCRVLRDHDDLLRIRNRMARALPSDPN